jgi:hypothetical protein
LKNEAGHGRTTWKIAVLHQQTTADRGGLGAAQNPQKFPAVPPERHGVEMIAFLMLTAEPLPFIYTLIRRPGAISPAAGFFREAGGRTCGT